MKRRGEEERERWRGKDEERQGKRR